MIHKRMVLVLIVIALSPGSARAESGKADEPSAIADRFFETVKSGEASQAIDRMFKTNPWFEKNPDQVQKLRTSFLSLNGLVGEYLGNELLLEKKVSTRYVYRYYFALYERQPIKVELEFYRPRDTWMLLNFAFNADVVSDLKEAAKYHLGDGLD